MTAAVEASWADQLIELLDRQRNLYAQLNRLSQEQTAIVGGANPDVAGLVLLLGKRQNLVDHLTRIGQQMEPYRRNWPQLWRSLDAAARARVQTLISQVQQLLETILRADDRDRASLSGIGDTASQGRSRLDRE